VSHNDRGTRFTAQVYPRVSYHPVLAVCSSFNWDRLLQYRALLGSVIEKPSVRRVGQFYQKLHGKFWQSQAGSSGRTVLVGNLGPGHHAKAAEGQHNLELPMLRDFDKESR